MQEEYNQEELNAQQDTRKNSSLSRLDFFKLAYKQPIKSSTLLKALPFVVAGSIFLFISVFAWVNLNKLDNKIAILEEEIEQIEELYKRDSTEYHDLKNSPSLIEHIAREDYYMKSEGEEIYVIKKVSKNKG